MYPSCIRELIDCLRDLPGVSEKSAERMAFSILNMDKSRLDDFTSSLESIKQNIKKCPICNNYTDMDVCSICSDSSRDSNTIFVVEKPKDVVLFEKMGSYHGKYHVLGGLISPLDSINPEDIDIDGLVNRVKDGSVKEIIVVLKPSIEGETTMQYIKKIISKYDVRVSKIPIGIPVGTDIEYIDSMTLEMAFEDRKDVV